VVAPKLRRTDGVATAGVSHPDRQRIVSFEVSVARVFSLIR
jgi:hypothetical protein